MDWFRDDRGIVKWWDGALGIVTAARGDPTCKLACQVAFSARFHRPSLEVETIRYFYDDESVGDVLGEETATLFPAKLIRDIGFFLVPASRTWDRTVSFGSELFRRVVAAGAGQPFESVLSERDRLRNPQDKLEEDHQLSPIVARLNTELSGFFLSAPTLHLRVTATDSDGLLETVVPHYRNNAAGLALPAKRHGSGLLSLQHLLLLLQFARMRAEASEEFWMALEEPELHVPPPLQKRLVHRLQALSSQTFVSTHSPTVASLADPKEVLVLRNEAGTLSSVTLLPSPLPADTPNGVRKLFQVNRTETIAALMHECVLVPEGRTDYEWLSLLLRAVNLNQGWATAEDCHFGSFVGVVPTHDSSVVRTTSALNRLHHRVVAIVDGDAEGVAYTGQLTGDATPNSGVIFRWPAGEMIEDIIGWIVEADAGAIGAISIAPPIASIQDLKIRLKSDDRAVHGIKKDTSSYEIIADVIGSSDACCVRARLVLNALSDAAQGRVNPNVTADADNLTLRVFQR